mgnify:CR=1
MHRQAGSPSGGAVKGQGGSQLGNPRLDVRQAAMPGLNGGGGRKTDAVIFHRKSHHAILRDEPNG